MVGGAGEMGGVDGEGAMGCGGMDVDGDGIENLDKRKKPEKKKEKIGMIQTLPSSLFPAERPLFAAL